MRRIRRLSHQLVAALVVAVLPTRAATAQWSQVYEQFYLQAPHNWTFRTEYSHADRLFNAFDYGHAILYETLWRKPDAPASRLEEKEYAFLVNRVLVRPPRNPLEEAAIEPMYARLAPEAKMMFDWAHVLHRQLYDVLADERLDRAAKDREVQRIIAYYKSRPDLAFSSRPKSMALMQEQPYSLAFRKRYPKFNGLIWGYHWLQIGLYEPLVTGTTREARQAGVRATVSRFFQMLQDAPTHMPHQMPMTPAVAPAFAARYPEAGIIFDNLHSMHDVVSDILTNPAVPRDRKRAEILRAARLFKDDTSYVMGSTEAWVRMSQHMGVENMGGPAVGFLPSMPTPTVTYGAVMTHDDRTGEMTGFKYGSATGGDHAAHGAPVSGGAGADAHAGHGAAAPVPAPAGGHEGHAMPAAPSAPTAPAAAAAAAFQLRMLGDSLIRARVMADTAMHRLAMEAMQAMPPEQRAEVMQRMHGAGHDHGAMHGAAGAATFTPPSRRGATPRPRRTPKAAAPGGTTPRAGVSKPAVPTPAPTRDPHAGHGTHRP
ncbi:MAG: hypothetical protein MUF21_00190 [Gemmatimonadaceae bacterium]|jgi:hypothetical protein|nr:hypothetical protein [Gemmatimonadaceae bacterium]